MTSKKNVISEEEKIGYLKADNYNLKPPLCIGSLDSKHCSYVLWDNIGLTRRCNNSSVCTSEWYGALILLDPRLILKCITVTKVFLLLLNHFA